MITQAPQEQDVFSSTMIAPDPIETLAAFSADLQSRRFPDLCHEHHRQAAQTRIHRLRTIEQIRRMAR